MRFKSFSIDGKKVKTLSIDGYKVKFAEEAGGPFRMTAIVGSPDVSLNKVGAAPDVNLQYSYDNASWTPYVVGEEVNIPQGGTLYWKAVGSNVRFATGASAYNKFYAHNGGIRIDGDLNSLLEEENYEGMSLAGRGNYVFCGLFRDCVGLGMVGDIFTSDVLSPYCYQYMFRDCNQLVEAPSVLPATTLADYCYYSMFYNCSSLTKAPALPATALTSNCYYYMFSGCSSLTKAPELPATTLAANCYNSMFYNCSSLTKAPALPATTLDGSCYGSMFNGCSNLNKIKISYTGDFTSTYFSNWVNGVASRGDIEYDGEDRTQGVGAIPFGWTVNGQEVQFTGLTFTAEEANSSVSLQKNGSAPAVSLMTSTDGMVWTPYEVGTTIMLNNVGDTVRFRATTTNPRMASSASIYNYFVMTGKIAASGNIMSLLNNLKSISTTYAFANLFKGCSSLTKAPELPATTLANYCYQYMFLDCSSLTQAPELPAMTLTTSCYNRMFSGCSSLIQAPELPATTMVSGCYNSMFLGCSSLTQAPELPATTLAANCYNSMFLNCKSLTKAPALPATTLANYCYSNMFSGCNNLNEMDVYFTSWSGTSTTTSWLNNVSATGTFRCPQALIDATTSRGSNTVPAGWTMISND